jgi:hypothetical protein
MKGQQQIDLADLIPDPPDKPHSAQLAWAHATGTVCLEKEYSLGKSCIKLTTAALITVAAPTVLAAATSTAMTSTYAYLSKRVGINVLDPLSGQTATRAPKTTPKKSHL